MPSSAASVEERFLKQMLILHAKRLYLITAQKAFAEIRHGCEREAPVQRSAVKVSKKVLTVWSIS